MGWGGSDYTSQHRGARHWGPRMLCQSASGPASRPDDSPCQNLMSHSCWQIEAPLQLPHAEDSAHPRYGLNKCHPTQEQGSGGGNILPVGGMQHRGSGAHPPSHQGPERLTNLPKTTQLARGPVRTTHRLALPVALACLPLCCLHQHWGYASRRAPRLHKPSPPPHPHPVLPELTLPHPARPERRDPAHTRLGSLPSHTGHRPGLGENRGPKKQRPEVSRLGCD